MHLSDVLNLEVDLTTLGIDFESYITVEYEDVEDEYVGVQFTKTYSSALDLLLITSLDLELLNDNISKLFDDYEINATIEPFKTINKTIKQYQLVISIFKNRDLWEETYHA